MWICLHCGSENSDETVFCSECGQEYVPDEADTMPGDDAYQDDPYPEDDGFVEPELPQGQEMPTFYEEDPAEPVVRPAKKKKKSKFKKVVRKTVKRIRRFGRNVAELPSRTLLILGGSIALILVVIILLVVLIPKSSGTPKVEETPVPEATAEPEVTPEPEITPTPEPVVTPHPMESLNLEDGRTYLKEGDSAPIVATIQQRLIALGYMDMPVVDGVAAPTEKYGKATKAAVRKFQYINNISVDGCVGPTTYDVIFSDTAKAYQLSGAYDSSIFEDDIIKMQNRLIELGYLSDIANGKFDDATVAAVRAFQEKNGLSADGVAGAQTLELLYSTSALKAS